MRAIILAAFVASENEPALKRQPRAMRLLMDRPMIQHVVEVLVEQGVTEFDFVLHESPEILREFLGDGGRWGSRFQFHLSKTPDHPWRTLKHLSSKDPEEPIVLARADSLPALTPGELAAAAQSSGPTLYCHAASVEGWSGWAVLSGKSLADLLPEEDFARKLFALAGECGTCTLVAEVLQVTAWRDCLVANARLLDRAFPGIAGTGKESDDGVYLGWNVRMHPSAKLIPPLYLGDQVKVEAGATLGPNVVVSRDCLIGSGSTLKDTLVFPRSYVGESLELDGCVVDHNQLVNVRLGTCVAITDSFLLGDISETILRSALRKIASQLLAGLLLLVFLPLLVAVCIYRKLAHPGPLLHSEEVIRLPAEEQENSWQTFNLKSFASAEELSVVGPWGDFLLRFMPGLFNVLQGHLCLVGMPPRSGKAIRGLDPDWQKLYLGKFAGLIREADLYHGLKPSIDDHYVAEAYYAAKNCFSHDLVLVKGYLARLWRRVD